MKKLLFLSVLILAVSCAKDDGEQEENQGYTSFIVVNKTPQFFLNSIAAYYDESGLCVFAGELGDLAEGGQSPEIKTSDGIEKIYIFSDFAYPSTIRFDIEFILKRNIKNILTLEGDFRGVRVDRYNPFEFPESRKDIYPVFN
jgi:hypothetical protein